MTNTIRSVLVPFFLVPGSLLLTACSVGNGTDKTPTTPAVSVAAVQVSLPTQSLYVGATTQATVVVKDQSGNAMSGQAVSWNTSDAAIATVGQTGLVTGIGAGSATITASVGTHQGSAVVTVTLVPVASVLVTPATNALYVGETQQLTAVARDSAGNILANRTTTWNTSDGTMATVSSSGLVSAIGVGGVTITATIGAKSGEAAASVGLPTIQVAMDSIPVARMGALYFPTLRVRVMFGGQPLVGYALQWATKDSTNGWVFPIAPVTDSAGYATANWVSGPATSAQVSVQGNGVTFALPFQVSPFSTTTNGRGTTWTDATGVQADGFRVTLNAATAPTATYYAAMQFTDGYAGYQVQGDGTHNLIFTIWDDQGVTASVIYQDPGAVCGHYTSEGNFAHCLETYPWNVNHAYGFELDMVMGNGYSDYTLFVTDSSTGTQLKYATIRGVPHKGAYPLGSGGFSTWTEDFGSPSSSCFTTGLHDLTATNPAKLVNGIWQPMTGALHGSTEYTRGCQNVSLTKAVNGVRMTGGGYRVDPPMPPNTSYIIHIP